MYTNGRKTNNNRFSGNGCYRCDACGKMTRETGKGESALGMCKACVEANEIANSINDGDMTIDEVPYEMRDLVESFL